MHGRRLCPLPQACLLSSFVFSFFPLEPSGVAPLLLEYFCNMRAGRNRHQRRLLRNMQSASCSVVPCCWHASPQPMLDCDCPPPLLPHSCSFGRRRTWAARERGNSWEGGSTAGSSLLGLGCGPLLSAHRTQAHARAVRASGRSQCRPITTEQRGVKVRSHVVMVAAFVEQNPSWIGNRRAVVHGTRRGAWAFTVGGIYMDLVHCILSWRAIEGMTSRRER